MKPSPILVALARRALPGLVLGLLAPVGRGQGYVVWQALGGPPGSGFPIGASVAGVGDQNGDGIPDLLVGAPSGILGTGVVRVLSGASGTTLLVAGSPAVGGWFGYSVAAAGDLDGDGKSDLLVGSPGFGAWPTPAGPGSVRVLSGTSGSVLLTVAGVSSGDAFGTSVAAAGDANGDGTADFLVGAPQGFGFTTAGAGYVTVVSGSGGTPLMTSSGASAGDEFGFSVCGLGDVDGDGTPDFAAGAPMLPPVLPGPAGYVRVISGATGGTIVSLTGVPNDRFGFSVAGGGDLNGDGVGDLLVGSPQVWDFGSGVGYVQAFTAATGSLLFTASGNPLSEDAFGFSIAFAGDLDGDGFDEAIVGAPFLTDYVPHPPGYARVLSGPTGTTLATLETAGSSLATGASVAAAGDLNGDGIMDLAVGQPGYSTPTAAGRVVAFSLAGIPSGSSLFGAGCAGSGGLVPVLGTAGGPPSASSGNALFQVVLSKALGGADALLVAGVSSTSAAGTSLPFDLGAFGMPGCSLRVSMEVLIPTGTGGAGPGAGVSFVSIPVPAAPTLVGQDVYLQAYVVDPGPSPAPGAITGGLRVRLL
ncbi:MAG TPA: VCBS repeat-containing protein [Planctomycetota bacterium]|jgi:hypothetical protein|nr:VCBS repeat-containing protein [Planctomycetota bacterium]